MQVQFHNNIIELYLICSGKARLFPQLVSSFPPRPQPFPRFSTHLLLLQPARLRKFGTCPKKRKPVKAWGLGSTIFQAVQPSLAADFKKISAGLVFTGKIGARRVGGTGFLQKQEIIPPWAATSLREEYDGRAQGPVYRKTKYFKLRQNSHLNAF